MSKALAAKESTALAMSEGELLTVLESSLYPGAAMESIKLVVSYCKAAGLDIMQKPVHIVPIWDGKAGRMRDVVMPGIGLYRTQAMRGGTFAGLSEPEFGEDVSEKVGGFDITYPKWCKVVAKRVLPNGTIAEFPAVERWKENYAVKGGKEKSIAPNAMWAKRPYGQLAKCAEAQALRKAFPELGAAPTAEEMEGKEIDMGQAEVVREPSRPEIQAYPQADFDKNLPAWRDAIEGGKRTAEQIIAMVSTKGILSDAQKDAILSTPEPGEDGTESFYAAYDEAEMKEAAR